MDEQTEHKVRNLKMKILRLDRELAAKQHGAGLNALLSVGHASQIAKASERDRKRLEAKLDQLRTQLAELEPGAAVPSRSEKPEKAAAAPVKKAAKPAEKAQPKTAVKPKAKAPAKPAAKKTAATKSAAAKTGAKTPAKKK